MTSIVHAPLFGLRPAKRFVRNAIVHSSHISMTVAVGAYHTVKFLKNR